MALGWQRGHRGVSEETPLSGQRWLQHGFSLPTPAAASPQHPPPGRRAARAPLIPKNPPNPAAPRHAKGCSFPQRLRAAAARPGGAVPDGGDPLCLGLLQPGQPPTNCGGFGGAGGTAGITQNPHRSQCPARSPGCDNARGFEGSASPSVTPQHKRSCKGVRRCCHPPHVPEGQLWVPLGKLDMG